jgi:UDP-N-acetyl-2-amino-2-deoxyglucuronate dehydrogenase
MQPLFAITGVGGFVAPRHLEAIKAVGGKLVAALDPHDAVGILDKYDRGTQFFTDTERFERELTRLRYTGGVLGGIDWLSVCSPNHLHDAHARLGMRVGANVICEKPLALSPWNIDSIARTEEETGRRVYTVLQLRLLPVMQELHAAIIDIPPYKRAQVELRYVTPRGRWYDHSWKGDVERSGGLITNIGIHLLDLVLWLFGPVRRIILLERSPRRAHGKLILDDADVSWFLSIDASDSPTAETYRRLSIDGQEIDFGDITRLHTKVYEEILAGRGFPISEARPAVELAHRLRYMPPLQ